MQIFDFFVTKFIFHKKYIDEKLFFMKFDWFHREYKIIRRKMMKTIAWAFSHVYRLSPSY